jgi:Gpi18-like mannosyltransferase
MALCFLAFNKERENWAQMFNDEVMVLYLAMAIYFLAKGKPLTGVFWFSMAYGIKAGALLLIPSMLGSIQYNHGIVKLIQCIVLLVGFQVAIAWPFL